jgi:hypothetical protein
MRHSIYMDDNLNLIQINGHFRKENKLTGTSRRIRYAKHHPLQCTAQINRHYWWMDLFGVLGQIVNNYVAERRV